MDTINNLSIALFITVVGMGLVFGGILILWLVMSLLVRFTADAEDADAPAEAGLQTAEVPAPAAATSENARRAAAAAVAVALATQRRPLTRTTASSTISAWQSVTRARQLKQRGQRR